MLLDTYLYSIAQDLNDAAPGHAYSSWSKDQLLGYVNEGMCLAAVFRPNLFATEKIVKLSPGSEQKVCDCTSVQKVLQQTDKYGNALGGSIGKQKSPGVYRWRGTACVPAGKYVLRAYEDSDVEGEFKVVPPVPAQGDYYVRIVCNGSPGNYSGADLDEEVEDCQVMVAVKHWVMFMALSVEMESSTALAAAKDHLRLFFSLLQVEFNRDMLQQLGLRATTEATNALKMIQAAQVFAGVRV